MGRNDTMAFWVWELKRGWTIGRRMEPMISSMIGFCDLRVVFPAPPNGVIVLAKIVTASNKLP